MLGKVPNTLILSMRGGCKLPRKRNCQFLVRMSETEFNQLNEAVAKSGYNREEYVRSLLFGRIPREKPSQDFFEMIQQLRKIGININQLTMIAHRTNSIDIMKLKKELNYLNQSIGDIREQVLLPRKVED